MLLYAIETVIYQYLQLILQCYFNGHAVAPLVVVGAFLITGFWLTVTSWGQEIVLTVFILGSDFLVFCSSKRLDDQPKPQLAGKSYFK